MPVGGRRRACAQQDEILPGGLIAQLHAAGPNGHTQLQHMIAIWFQVGLLTSSPACLSACLLPQAARDSCIAAHP